MLKKAAEALSIPITIIYTKSFQTGLIPKIWKQANITPLHKSGCKLMLNNYRPVSLTCILCKVFESIFKDVMLKHLLENKLISNAQHGFMPSRSCSTNLLETIDLITSALASGFPVDIIYTDFSKAFDKISHTKIGENIIRWICDFLSQRTQ